jgi:pantoate--beta-alanine ligase
MGWFWADSPPEALSLDEGPVVTHAANQAEHPPTMSPIVIRTIAEMRALRASWGTAARVGFVPTMGALHAGHTGLLAAARAGGCAHTVASIFVNPAQFAPHEDLSRYPRTWDADLAALAAQGCSAVFAPSAAEMYPRGAPFAAFVCPKGVDEGTPEGRARPGFFRGVATVVLKLLNIVAPTEAWFGQKDGVQCVVVRGLVRDLNVATAVRVGPTARAEDGLALSSRNAYLTPPQRARAGGLYAALRAAKAEFDASPEAAALLLLHGSSGRGVPALPPPMDDAAMERAAQSAAFGALPAAAAAAAAAGAGAALEPALERTRRAFLRGIEACGGAFSGVEYCEFSDASTGQRIARLEDSHARNGAVLLSVVVKMGSVRLLDNIMLVGSVDDLGEGRVGAEKPF